jgi:hypothetical protein
MARNCIVSMLAASMLLCTLNAADAQQDAQPAPSAQPRPNVGDNIPQSWGGLPADTPARPKTVLPTPAVHDLPPPRPGKPLSDSEQLTLEKELDAARDRHKKLEDPSIAKQGSNAAAAGAAAGAQARKKAGNPAPKPAKP